jgi:outer membrane protein OmpA-like peptidoglycan-associated protein
MLAGLVAVIGVVGCSRVKPDQLQTELTTIRQEIASGDSALAGRITANDQRIDALTTRLDSLERDLQALRTEFNASVQRMETAVRFNVPVHFDFDDATIRESDRPMLDRFAQVASKYYAEATVTVEGFADPAGNASYNLALGMDRAEAVRDYLTSSGGLTADKMKAVSYGEASNRQVVPGAQGPGEVGVENRRVALVIDYAGAAPAATSTASSY